MRELENVHRARGGAVRRRRGPRAPPAAHAADRRVVGHGLGRRCEDIVEAVEKDALQDALKRARGNGAVAARLLRTTRRIFRYKVRNYGVDWRRFE